MRRDEIGQRLDRRRGVELSAFTLQGQGFGIAQGRELRRDRIALIEETIGFARRDLVHAAAGGNDRLVARAAAEIAGQRILDAPDVRRGLVEPEREERHHEARRAEAALRAVALHHRLLDRMQTAIRAFEMLDREQLAAIQRRQEADAGIDRFIAQIAAVEPPDNDGAGAAIAFGAAFLRAGHALVEPQPVEHRQGRVAAVEFDQPVAEQEAQPLTHSARSTRKAISCLQIRHDPRLAGSFDLVQM